MASLILGAPPLFTPPQIRSSSRVSFSQSQTLGSSISTTHVSISVSSNSGSSLPLVYCGRGDRKTAKGKRFNHSFGNARPRNKNKGRGPARVPVTPVPPKKDRFEDNEVVKIEIDESFNNKMM